MVKLLYNDYNYDIATIYPTHICVGLLSFVQDVLPKLIVSDPRAASSDQWSAILTDCFRKTQSMAALVLVGRGGLVCTGGRKEQSL